MEVVQHLALSPHFHPVVDAQVLDGPIDADVASRPAEAFHAKKAVASGLTVCMRVLRCSSQTSCGSRREESGASSQPRRRSFAN
jgi:hypothetical protein